MQGFDGNTDGVSSQTGMMLQAGDAERHMWAWRGKDYRALGVFLESAGVNTAKNPGNSSPQCHTMGWVRAEQQTELCSYTRDMWHQAIGSSPEDHSASKAF